MASVLNPSTSIRLKIFIVLFLVLFQANAHSGHNHDEGDAGDEGENSLRSKSLIIVKIICLLILLVTTFAGGVSPYFLRWNESFLLLGTQFAGGIFLSTALMHFLADCNETFKDVTENKYPFAYMLASFGYMITMFGDCIIIWLMRGEESEVRIEALKEGGSNNDEEESKEEEFVHIHSTHGLMRNSSFGDTVLLILALCFHSVFEGIAIGVADTKYNAWRSLWTISLHKIFAAISMGIALLRMLPNRPLLITTMYSLAFAISSPIGVGIGIGINAVTQGNVADWIYAISMGLACGIFIYVAINHLIAKGFKPSNHCVFDTPFFKFVAVLAGVVTMAIVMIWD